MKTSFWGKLLITAAVLSALLASCASSDDLLVNKEPGFYYGVASGSTELATGERAMDDLIYNVLTESGSIKQERKAKVVITAEMKAAFAVFKLSPFSVEKKSPNSFVVIQRLAKKDWDKAELARLGKLRSEFGGAFTTLSKDSKKAVSGRLADAGNILIALNKHGVPQALTLSADAPGLLSAAIEKWMAEQMTGLVFSTAPETGLVKSGDKIAVKLTDVNNKAVAMMPVSIQWTGAKGSTVLSKGMTDNSGSLTLIFPEDATIKNQKLTLKLGTDVASLNTDVDLLAKLDAKAFKEFAYRHSDDLEKLGSDEIKVAGGAYTVGSVKQDTRAGSIEKARKVTVSTYYMDRHLVTNAQYLAYLEATNAPQAVYPDYWDNDDFNQPNQPVIGVSIEDATKYAAWISGLLGVKKRLPTEDEFEIAARGGVASIFPWGDQKPADGVRANYMGNGKFTNTSPVGSFASGTNPLGFTDMAGNVWQWTTTLPNGTMSGDASYHIVKGGSYLDGPNDLRISNRVLRNPTERHADVGFRLVREAGNE